MRNSRIIIIIPTYNRIEELSLCLSQLNRQIKSCPSLSCQIVIVVDGSTDGTLEMLERNFPEVEVVTGDGNWWYTKSMNQGFRRAKELGAEMVLTLNDDIVLDENYLEQLMEDYSSLSNDSILGSLSLTIEKPYRVTNSGIKKWNRLTDKAESYYPFMSEIQLDSVVGIYASPLLPGRGMLIPMKVLEKVGFFDERFKQYHSDFDFTLRALKAGSKIFISHNARVYSYVEKTASSSSFLKTSFSDFIKAFRNPVSRFYIPNKALYFWRHNPKVLWPLYMVKFILSSFRNFYFKPKLQ